ncbi:Icc protein [Halopseudomonas xinjiangensis]|uniref:Icc protein n=1 Tax=Halopseudomonas xinjiangensis TaxID=487184 RepID=A0A1H1M3F7_9GAMM|nr:3',5'-cyclic-AMP phosphodiesterase [Halopseudomonas xinjiangensis]SDR80905.1 Icc protein [Halopseudomonas xinjiangensis]
MPPTVVNEADHVFVIQITDSHLFADPAARLLGLDTHASLEAVIDQVLGDQSSMDIVLATGDITQDGSEGAYQRFLNAAARLPAEHYWIPGNHDDAVMMERIGRTAGVWADWVDAGQWRIVMLDSSVQGSVAGRLGDAEFERLDAALASSEGRHVMVCLHHHPISIGSDWMEPIGLRDAGRLMSRLDGAPEVKVVLWGHIHQQLDEQYGHLRLLATPSTCVQFAEQSTDFATDTRAPGYRWLKLFDDGRLETGVVRLPAGAFLPEEGASGY